MRQLATGSRIACLAIVMVVVACGGNGDGDPTAAPPTSTVAAATPTSAPPTPTDTPALEPTATSTVPAEPAEPVASTAWIPIDQLPEVRYTSADGAEAVLPVEVPPANEYTIGLSGRTELEERGMVFYYPSGEHTGAFWMRNTHIDLDIAFVDADFEVIAVLQMQADTLDRHRPGRPYLAAIEAPLGWYEANGIGAGAQAEFLFDIGEYLP